MSVESAAQMSAWPGSRSWRHELQEDKGLRTASSLLLGCRCRLLMHSSLAHDGRADIRGRTRGRLKLQERNRRKLALEGRTAWQGSLSELTRHSLQLPALQMPISRWRPPARWVAHRGSPAALESVTVSPARHQHRAVLGRLVPRHHGELPARSRCRLQPRAP